jgi:uncharacterized protein (TIGR02145 family)
MAGNLKTTRYRNGEIIPNVTDTAAWRQLQTGACRDYDNDKEKSAVYGKLYNWYAVKQGNLCPVNWHVPYDFEWQALVDSLGGAGAAGGILKEQGTAHWVSNTGATNVYGFSALPGGYSGIDGIFHELGRHAYWWSNTSQPDLILVRSVHYDNATMDRSEREKENGFSVRCVRDY